MALDTADEVFSAALATDTGHWYTEIDTGSGLGLYSPTSRHSELLMDCVDGLCKTAGLSSKELNLVACMKGPGSFTGIRIGFSAAKGLCLALDLPLRTVPTLDCVAYSLSAFPGLVLPAIDAKKSRYFAALYREGQRLTDYMDASPETLGETLQKAASPEEQVVLTGSGAESLGSLLGAHFPGGKIRIDPGFRRGRARELLEIIKASKMEGVNEVDTGPVYLRKSDAELNHR